MALRGPFESGRSYRLVTTGQEQENAYTVIAYVRPRVGVSTRQIIDLAPYDKQVRITALTADYIDLTFDFRLDKPEATPERIAMRVRNVLDENRTVRAQAETAPYWSYAKVSRTIERWGYNTEALPFNEYGYPPKTTRVYIQQGELATSTTQITYDGKTESASAQTITLAQVKTPLEQTRIDYEFQTKQTVQDWKRVEIVWPDFKGVGTYTGDKVTLRFTNSQGEAGFWRIHTGKLTNARTKWQVDVQRVTPDVIEGIYTITDAPLYEQAGSLPKPASGNVSGRFQMIYPR